MAPSVPARSILSRLVSTTMIRLAPAITAPITHDRPTPPRPMTATVEPAGTSAVLSTAPTPVDTAAADECRDLGRDPVGHRHDRRRRDDLRRGHRPDRAVGEDRRAVRACEPGRAVRLGVAHRRRGGADPLAPALALAAAEAGRVPAERDRPPDDARVDPRPDGLDDARALVAHDDRARPLPLAVADVEVAVADAGRRHPHEDLARVRVVKAAASRSSGAALPARSPPPRSRARLASSSVRRGRACPIRRRR